jgi:hypothetical protein
MLTLLCGHLEFVVSSPWSRMFGSVEKRDAMTVLSGRRQALVDSARTGPGPGSCALTPLALAATLDAHHPLTVRLSSNVCGAARIAGQADDDGEAPEDAPRWDAA